jgi:hypothetical protein
MACSSQPRPTLESLMAAGTIDAALRLCWDARELIGLQRLQPHHPRAGLVFTLRSKFASLRWESIGPAGGGVSGG